MATATRSAKGKRPGINRASGSDMDGHPNDGLSDADADSHEQMDVTEIATRHATTAGAETASDDGEYDVEETDDGDERKLMPPPSGTPRQLTRRHPSATRGNRRSLRARHRSDSGSSTYYTSGADDDDAKHVSRKPSRETSRSNSRQRGGGDQAQPLKIAYVTSATGVPPPQQHDPTIHFTEAVKKDERYGFAAARTLAQMAIRDGCEITDQSPEPELIAYNLRIMGAAELISHRSPDYSTSVNAQSTSRPGWKDNRHSYAELGPVTELERAEVIAKYLADQPKVPKRPTLVLRDPRGPTGAAMVKENLTGAATVKEKLTYIDTINELQACAAVETAASHAERQIATQVGASGNAAALPGSMQEAYQAINWGPSQAEREHAAAQRKRQRALAIVDQAQRKYDNVNTVLQQVQEQVRMARQAAEEGVEITLPDLTPRRNYWEEDQLEREKADDVLASAQEKRRRDIITGYLRQQTVTETARAATETFPSNGDGMNQGHALHTPELTFARLNEQAALCRAQQAEEQVKRLRAENSARESASWSSLDQPAPAGLARPAAVPPLASVSNGTAPAQGEREPYGVFRKMRCKVPEFKGGNWAAFRQQFEKLARYYSWDEETKGVYLHTSICGEAADALAVEDSASWSYDQLIEHLDKRHGRSKTYAQVLNEICSLFRRSDQTNTQWHDAVIKVANTAHLSGEQYRHVAYHGFTFGLRMFPALQTWVLNRDDKRTLVNACALAEKYEHEYGLPVYVHLPLTVDSATTFVHEKVIDPPAAGKATNTDATELAQLVRDMRAQMPKNGQPAAAKKNQPQQQQRDAPSKQESAPHDQKQQQQSGNFRGRGRGRQGKKGRPQNNGRGGDEQRQGLNEQAVPFTPYEQQWAQPYPVAQAPNWNLNVPPPMPMPPPNGFYPTPAPASAAIRIMPPPPTTAVPRAAHPRAPRNSSAH